jgi:aconitate hydratase
LLGVRAVVAESFEHIHRSNLIGMGVLPLRFRTALCKELKLDGSEIFDILGIADRLAPRAPLTMRIHRISGIAQDVELELCADTNEELAAYRHGGILPQVYREFVEQI